MSIAGHSGRTYELRSSNPNLDIIDIDIDNSSKYSDSTHGTSLEPKYNMISASEASTTGSRSFATSNRPWRVKNMTVDQAEVIEQWILSDQKPTTQQKDDLLRGTSLTLDQLDGCLARARRTFSMSHKATRGKDSVRQEVLTDLSSDWSDVMRDNEDARNLSEGIPDTEDLGLWREDYDSTLTWWLLGIGDHLAQASGQHSHHDGLDLANGVTVSWDARSDNSGGFHSIESSNNVSNPRQGRKVQPGPKSPSISGVSTEAREPLFHCTMCDDFSSPSINSWRRHELQQHIRPPSWICEPSKLNMDGVPLCSFCDQKIGSSLCVHEVHKCLTTVNRAFQRREHLEGHLVRVHKLDAGHAKRIAGHCKVDGDVDVNDVDLTCYFCGEVMISWDARAKHIGDHYRKETLTKAQWDKSKVDMKRPVFEGRFGSQ